MTELYGFNRHVWDIDPAYFTIQRKYILVIETTFCFASGLIKISILLFYRRLSSRAVSSTFRWATWITIGFIVAYSVAFILVPIFGCNPISAFWDQINVVKIAQGYKYHCFNEGADVFAAGVISAAQDLITAMLPTLLYWNLHLPLRQKIALFGIFAIGYSVVAMGAMRAYYSWHIFFGTYDVTWAGWDNMLWTLLELHIGAMCANSPALKVFFTHFLHIERLSKSRSRSNKSKSNSNINAASAKSSKTGSTAVEKFSFWKHSRTQTKKGYISEPHTDVSIDMHGGVHIQKEVHVTHSLRSDQQFTESQDAITAHENDIDYDLDIELGSWETEIPESPSGSNSGRGDEDDVQALPPMPSQPQPVGGVTEPPRAHLTPFPPKSEARSWRPKS